MTLINPSFVQPGDQIVINNNPVVVSYIEKDIHGFNTYVEDHGTRKYVFIPEEDKVTIIA